VDWFAFIVLVITGFTACAEFGSYAFVHPVVRHLPTAHRIRVEQGLLKTFGRVMPPLMVVTLILGISYALHAWSDGGAARVLGLCGAVSFGVAIVSTVIVNVPINLATGTWDPEQPPPNWERTRGRWEFFQGVRSWLLVIGFVFMAATVAAQLART
jgi:hypothetical protein